MIDLNSLPILILPSQNAAIPVVITGYSFTYSGSIQSAQKRQGLEHYPIRATQQGFSFTIKCRSEEQWQKLKKLISQHQEDVLTTPITSDGFFRLLWPSQDIDYTLLIKSVVSGAARFQFSPDLIIGAELIFDNIFSVSNQFFNPGDSFDVIPGIITNNDIVKPISWVERLFNSITGQGNPNSPFRQ